MSQLIVIGSHWGFAGCSLVSHWGSLRVIWWTFGGHSRFLKNFNFDFGNKFDFLICHSVLGLNKKIVGINFFCLPVPTWPHTNNAGGVQLQTKNSGAKLFLSTVPK